MFDTAPNTLLKPKRILFGAENNNLAPETAQSPVAAAAAASKHNSLTSLTWKKALIRDALSKTLKPVEQHWGLKDSKKRKNNPENQ